MNAALHWLVLDTATPSAVVGVVRGGRVLAEHVLSETKKHAEGIIDAIDRALLAAGLGLDEIGGVAVGVGPGSFIGVRTGIATAKGICLGRRIPLIGVPTLVALAYSTELRDGAGFAVIDAKRGEVFAQLVALAYSTELRDGAGFAVIDAKRGEVFAQLVASKAGVVTAIEPPSALSPAAFVERARKATFVVGNLVVDGDAIEATKRVELRAPSAHGVAQALLQRIAGGVVDEVLDLVPDYCRAPDAKLPATDPNARRDLVDAH